MICRRSTNKKKRKKKIYIYIYIHTYIYTYIKIDLENLSFCLKGFLIFALHCAPNSQVSFIRKKKRLCRVRVLKSCTNIWVPFLFTLLVYRQIRERFKRKVRTLFSSATDGNSTKKNLNVNLIDFVMWMQLNWSFVMSLNWKRKKTRTPSA